MKPSKKLNNLFNFFIIFSVLVLLIGISGCPQEEGKKIETVGLTLSFIENAPPNDVIVGQKFPIYVETSNQGDSTINAGDVKIYISGVGANLEGVAKVLSNRGFMAKGSIERLDFAKEAKFTLPIEMPFSLRILARSCYGYGTDAQANICVAASNTTTICNMDGEKISANTAAPVQVSNFQEELIANKLYVSFTIENKGSGEVSLPTLDCDKREAFELSETLKQNKVKMLVTTEAGWNCKVQTETEPYTAMDSLVGAVPVGSRISCFKTVSGEEAHVVPFIINLHYKYRDSLIKQINVLPS